MLSFDEISVLLDDMVDSLPQALFRELNGGVNLLPNEKMHPANCGLDNLYILGEYIYEPNGLGRYVIIYYGSLAKTHGCLHPKRIQDELRRVLLHELTHHMESLAGERDLEIKDAYELERYRKG